MLVKNIKSLLCWLFLPAVVGSFFFGVSSRPEVNSQSGAMELRLAVSNLEKSSDSLSPQLKEYLKGRIYRQLASGVRSGWVDSNLDYGPIDRSILGPIKVVKDATSDIDLYKIAMQKTKQ